MYLRRIQKIRSISSGFSVALSTAIFTNSAPKRFVDSILFDSRINALRIGEISNMYETADSPLLSTHEAARLVGYTHDYIARMCREGRIRATRSGSQWMIDPEALERFKEAHEERLTSSRAAVAVLRKQEFAGALAVAFTHKTARAMPHRSVVRIMQETVAIAVALMVTCGSFVLAESGVVNRVAEGGLATGLAAAEGFSIIIDSMYAEMAAQSKKPVIARDFVAASGASGVVASPLYLPGVHPIVTNTVFTQPTVLPSSPVQYFPRAYRQTTAAANHLNIARVGNIGLSLGTVTRDIVTTLPKKALSSAAGLGKFFAGTSDMVLSLHHTAVFALATLPEPLARSTISIFYTIGRITEETVARAPHALADGYQSSLIGSVNISNKTAYTIVKSEVGLGQFLQDTSRASSLLVYESIYRGEMHVVKTSSRIVARAEASIPYKEVAEVASAVRILGESAEEASASVLIGALRLR